MNLLDPFLRKYLTGVESDLDLLLAEKNIFISVMHIWEDAG
jgi:hypothetical protein